MRCPPPTWRPLGAVLTAVLTVVVLASCGSGEDDEKTAADNLAKQILTAGSTGSSSVTEEQAHCVADGTVQHVGLDRLQKYGIITDDLTVDKGVQNVKMTATDAGRLAKVFVSCLDSERLVEDQFLGGDSVTPAQKKCVRDVIDGPSTQEILSRSFQGQAPEDVYSGVRPGLKKCAKLEPKK